MLFIQNLMNLFVDEIISEIGSIEDKESPRTDENSDFLKSWAVESLPGILKFLKLDCGEKLPVQKEIMKFLSVPCISWHEVTSFELVEKFRWPKFQLINN
ncbi:DNA polymerase V-like protein, putative [Medicago truncatula]|uniref:DNA polymerase V-like protein, putative n=1 Tax=Medicago truncatula TaxID=3880 RepID=G7ITR7_MEDTR|nr:DNA polymerase V-like protein, putative [Medicago truncatula]